jgi:hypothetical protein
MTKLTASVEGIEGFTTGFALEGFPLEDAELKLFACGFSLSPTYWTVHVTDLIDLHLYFI